MAALQLFCLPYSGASAMFYNRWRRHVPEWLKLHPLELPGRGIRFNEPLTSDMSALADALARQVGPQLQLPYAVLGHSMGALLGFELVHALQALGCPSPLALYASGATAPTQREDRLHGYDRPKSDAELLSELRRFRGTPKRVLTDRDLINLTLPVLRADFLMCGRYRYRLRPQLRCPLHVFAGKLDDMSAEQLTAWADETSGKFSLDRFDGGHFFIHEQEPAVLRVLSQRLAADLQQLDADAVPSAAFGA